MLTNAFDIKLVRSDDGDGLVGFEASTRNGQFSGVAAWWGYVSDLLPLADALKGFLKEFDEKVALQFTENCVLVFECIDRLGRVIVKASLSTNPDSLPFYEPNQTVVLTFATEAAAIDEFASNLSAFGQDKAQAASLSGTAP